MARIQLVSPEHYPFSMKQSVRFKDINSGKHLGNDHLVSLLLEARIAFFTTGGFDEVKEDRYSLPVADLGVRYLGEAFFQELLTFEVAPAEVGSKSFELHYRVTKTDSGDRVALAKTGIVCIDRETQKASPLPDHIRRCLV